MNTYTNMMNPKKEVQQAARNSRFPNAAVLATILTLVIAVAIGVFITKRAAVAAEDSLAVPYSNAMEMQYARPWLEARNGPAVAYSNALEMQYARPWLEAQDKPAVMDSTALELHYAQPWLEAQNKPVVEYSNALELQYAQPWLDKQELGIAVTGNVQEEAALNCSSRMEMLYACKFGFGLP